MSCLSRRPGSRDRSSQQDATAATNSQPGQRVSPRQSTGALKSMLQRLSGREPSRSDSLPHEASGSAAGVSDAAGSQGASHRASVGANPAHSGGREEASGYRRSTLGPHDGSGASGRGAPAWMPSTAASPRVQGVDTGSRQTSLSSGIAAAGGRLLTSSTTQSGPAAQPQPSTSSSSLQRGASGEKVELLRVSPSGALPPAPVAPVAQAEGSAALAAQGPTRTSPSLQLLTQLRDELQTLKQIKQAKEQQSASQPPQPFATPGSAGAAARAAAAAAAVAAPQLPPQQLRPVLPSVSSAPAATLGDPNNRESLTGVANGEREISFNHGVVGSRVSRSGTSPPIMGTSVGPGGDWDVVGRLAAAAPRLAPSGASAARAPALGSSGAPEQKVAGAVGERLLGTNTGTVLDTASQKGNGGAPDVGVATHNASAGANAAPAGQSGQRAASTAGRSVSFAPQPEITGLQAPTDSHTGSSRLAGEEGVGAGNGGGGGDDGGMHWPMQALKRDNNESRSSMDWLQQGYSSQDNGAGSEEQEDVTYVRNKSKGIGRK